MRSNPHKEVFLDPFQSGDFFPIFSRDKWQLLSDTLYLTKMRSNHHDEMFLDPFQGGDISPIFSRDKW